MANPNWQGGASPTTQVQTYTMAGTWATNDTILVTIGSKSWTYTLTSGTIATWLPLMVTAFNALSSSNYPEFTGAMTASATSPVLSLTAITAGKPFTATLTPTSAAGTIEGAGVATTGTAATVCTGPNFWNNAKNWSTGAVPVNSDNVTIDGGPSILYGLAQSAVTLATLTITPNFSSTSVIGLTANTNPQNPTSGYPQYLAQRLAIGATIVNIETTSPLVRLDLSSASTTVTVSDTGSPQIPTDDALDLKLAATANVYILKGKVGVNALAGDTGTVAILDLSFRANQSSDCQVRGGTGLTVTLCNQGGGTLLLQNGATTYTNKGGVMTLTAGNVTTLTNQIGTVYQDGTSTITTLNNLGTFLKRGFKASTITNTNIYGGSITSDRNGTITFSNAMTLVQCRLSDGPQDQGRDVAYVCLGTNRTLAQG